jgi:TRAP-type mannitol/chloroaromatic compound transport system substrate-binding protein
LNQKSYQALPDDLKSVVQEAAVKYYDDLVDLYEQELQNAADLVSAGKIKESWLDEACEKTYADEAMKVWSSVAERDPANAKAIEMVKRWRGL